MTKPTIPLTLLLTGLTLTTSTHALDYTYDALNRLVQVTYADGQAIHYTYDAAGNLLSVSQSGVQANGTQTPDATSADAEASS